MNLISLYIFEECWRWPFSAQPKFCPKVVFHRLYLLPRAYQTKKRPGVRFRCQQKRLYLRFCLEMVAIWFWKWAVTIRYNAVGSVWLHFVSRQPFSSLKTSVSLDENNTFRTIFEKVKDPVDKLSTCIAEFFLTFVGPHFYQTVAIRVYVVCDSTFQCFKQIVLHTFLGQCLIAYQPDSFEEYDGYLNKRKNVFGAISNIRIPAAF